MILNQIFPLLLAPLFLILFIFYLKFKFEIKKFNRIFLALLLGMTSSLMLVLFYEISTLFGLENVRSLRRTLFFAFIITGFSSEFGKFLVLYLGFFKRKDFYGPIESIIYSLFISTGFSIIACFLYISGFISPIDNTIFLYLYTIGNLVFAIVLGFFVGLGKSRKNTFVDAVTGLLAASFFHGVLNFCILTEDYVLLLLIGVSSLIISIILIFKSFEYKYNNLKNINR